MMQDKIIIGAGLYGLYSALYCGKKNENVLVIEKDDQAFKRATYINQARVHMGYHYPRSYSTAIKSANYFEKFNKDYGFSILTEFDQIYATSKHFSWTNAKQFKKFCDNAKIMCEEVPTDKYFNSDMCDGAFLTEEYTYDAHILRDFLLKEISKYSNIQIKYSTDITKIYKQNTVYTVVDSNENEYSAPFILNSTYASTNEINKLLGFEPFKIKYELCEIILCEVNDVLKNTGITVMDGPFFSIMPFGKTGYHSLTSVTFTPHQTSYDELPTFGCQARSNGFCTPEKLGNWSI